jgi:hypothetical protein
MRFQFLRRKANYLRINPNSKILLGMLWRMIMFLKGKMMFNKLMKNMLQVRNKMKVNRVVKAMGKRVKNFKVEKVKEMKMKLNKKEKKVTKKSLQVTTQVKLPLPIHLKKRKSRTSSMYPQTILLFLS